MSLTIKNKTQTNKNYAGQMIAGDGSYLIPDSELSAFQTSDKLISDLTLQVPEAAIEQDGQEFTGSDAVNILLDLLPKRVESYNFPFAEKITPEGKKLFARTHGKECAVTVGSTTVDFDIPYPACKLTGLEIINGEAGDKVNLYILDDDSGTYSTIPNYQLNQFGFDANVAKDMYVRESNYDADLYYNMTISIEYISVSAKTVYINYILHEVKD